MFHAGTALASSGDVVTDGGRVLTVVADGQDLASARARAYAGADAITFEGRYMRRDVGADDRST